MGEKGNKEETPPTPAQVAAQRRGLHCCFCGAPVAAEDAVPLVYGAAMLKRPIFQAVFNPLILATFHRDCLERTPEVQVVMQAAGAEAGEEGAEDEEQVLDGEKTEAGQDNAEPPIIRLLRVAHQQRMQMNRTVQR